MPGQISEHFKIRQQEFHGLSEGVSQLSKQGVRRGLGAIRLEKDRTDPKTVEIVLSTVRPALGNYDLLARIDHRKGGKVYIRPMTGSAVNFAEVRAAHAEQHCDHCGVKRLRNTTFLLRGYGGTEVQVGSSCLKDYVGESDPRKALVQADLFAQARELVLAAVELHSEENKGRQGPRRQLPTVDDYLAHVAAVIASEGGFVRKVDVNADEAATASIAIANYRLGQARELDASGQKTWVEVGEKELVMARRAKQEFLETVKRDQLTGYDQVLSWALEKEVAWPDKQGMLATVFERVHSLRKRRQVTPTAPEDRWLAEQDEAVDIEARLVRTGTAVESKYGEQIPHYFVVDDGRRATWFATNKHLDVDRRYRIRGKVKRHDTYQGKDSTVLTGCRTELLEEPPGDS